MSLTDYDYELLSAYIDNELTDAERIELEARLSEDPELQEELDALRSVTMLVGNLSTLKAPRDFRLTADMVSDDPGSVAPPANVMMMPAAARRRAPLQLLSAVAALMIVAFFVVMLLQTNDRSSNQPQAVAIQSTNTVTAQPTKRLAVLEIVQGMESNATVLIPESPTPEPVAPSGESDGALRSIPPDSEGEESAFEGAGSDASGANLAQEFSVTETAAIMLLTPPMDTAFEEVTAADESDAAAMMESQMFEAEEQVDDTAFDTMPADMGDAFDDVGGDAAQLVPPMATSVADIVAPEQTQNEPIDSADVAQTATAMEKIFAQATESASLDFAYDGDTDDAQEGDTAETLPEMDNEFSESDYLISIMFQLISLVFWGLWFILGIGRV